MLTFVRDRAVSSPLVFIDELQMVMGNNTIWMRGFSGFQTIYGRSCAFSTVAYKQAALNAIAYLQKVCTYEYA